MRGESQTAIIAAEFRAAHALVDADPIFDDTLALALAGKDRHDVDALFEPISDSCAHVCRLFPCQRARFVEEEVEAAVGRGVRQYVDLGAGLDSFAWRRPDLMAELQLFEVDHPATQEWKRARLDAIGLKVPDNVHFAAIDLGAGESLAAHLAAAGFDSASPSVWSWLGVILYLPSSVIAATLHDIAAIAAPGSTLIASYRVPRELMDPASIEMDLGGTARAAALGEPQITWIDADEIEHLARAAGWPQARSVKPAQLADWFTARADGLGPVSYEWLLVAAT